jgi:hypothetical protein
MRVPSNSDTRFRLATACLVIIALLYLLPLVGYAQNLGQAPATG